jgi:hypothetical protein
VPEDLTHPPITAPADRSTQSIFTAGSAASCSVRCSFSLGGGGREVARSVAVERLRVRARWAKSRRMGAWFRLSLQVQANDPRRHRHD